VLKLDLNKDGKADAVIKVISPVPGADVYIDGGSVGAAPVEHRVSAGEHTVLVQRDGYKKFETKLKIEAGRTETVVAELQAVGKLRVLSDPPGAVVLVNGVPLDRKTPIEPPVELDVGVTVVRIEMDGRVAEEKTVKIEGGKTEVVSVELPVVGMTAVERQREQRGLSSFGARTLPRGRSTIDLGLGYPYFGEIRVNVGAGQVGGFGFDAGVSTRSFGARSELGLGLRFQLVDADPFHAGVFTDLWWGSKLLDNSKRNGLTGNLGLAASLTALTHVTVSGRAYLNLYSDRHCPALEGTTMFEADADPIPACTTYLQDLADGTVSDPTSLRMEELTGESGTSMFSRDNGLRLMTSIVAEIAVQQRWNVWFMLEGAPFQSERALFVHEFAVPMLKSDYATYGRLGATYKF
jgi:hypothetical protein